MSAKRPELPPAPPISKPTLAERPAPLRVDWDRSLSARLLAVATSGFASGDDLRVTFVTETQFVTWKRLSADVSVWELGRTTPAHTATFPFQILSLAARSGAVTAVGSLDATQLGVVSWDLKDSSRLVSHHIPAARDHAVAASLGGDPLNLIVAGSERLTQFVLDDASTLPVTLDRWPAGSGPGALVRSSNGQLVVGCRSSGLEGQTLADTVRVWGCDPGRRGLLFTEQWVGKPYLALVSPDTRSLVVATSAGTASVLDLQNPKEPVRAFLAPSSESSSEFGIELRRAHKTPIRAGAFSADGRVVVLAGGEPRLPTGEFVLWQLRSATRRLRVKWPKSLTEIAISPATSHVVAADQAGALVTWRLE